MIRAVVMLVALLYPAAAFAQWSGRPYLGAAIGPNFADTILSAGHTTQIATDPGPLGDLAIGWAFDNGLRTELEGSYGSDGVSTIDTRRTNGELLPLTNVHGSLTLPAIIANVVYDIRPDRFGWQWNLPVQPYVGAGVGYAWLDFGDAGGNGLTLFHLPQNNTFGPAPSVVSFGTGGALAYDVLAGVAWPIGAVPGLEATLEYRFLGTARADVPVKRVSAIEDFVNGALPSEVTHNGFEVHDNILLVGLRYQFDLPR
jgi:OmpA-OmpF porin, OOP family